MSVLKEYSDASCCKTYPKPLTDFKFSGLADHENEPFKIWLGLVGADELEVMADQALEFQFVELFKHQKEEKSQNRTPAQMAPHIYLWILQSEADKAWVALAHNCEFWQLVQHVPTQAEFDKAFPALSLEYAKPMQPVIESKEPKVKTKPVRDDWTMDLFGGAA